jgi:DNA polymerase I-like protein with 3'-5' exonuclease and polymerase domains
MAYGAGVKAIAADLGMSVEEVQAIIDAENILYPEVAKFYEELGHIVERSSKGEGKTRSEPHPTIAGKWRGYRTGDWSGPTGTLYRWRQWDAPDWLQKRGTMMTFSPTERKNWPVQGTGGEVMQMAQGILFRYFVEKGWWSNGEHDVLLTNTVHDCVWTDMDEDYTEEVINAIIQIMVAAPQFFEHRYKIKVPVKFSAEAEVGRDMYDMKHFTPCNSPEYMVNIDQLCERYL